LETTTFRQDPHIDAALSTDARSTCAHAGWSSQRRQFQPPGLQVAGLQAHAATPSRSAMSALLHLHAPLATLLTLSLIYSLAFSNIFLLPSIFTRQLHSSFMPSAIFALTLPFYHRCLGANPKCNASSMLLPARFVGFTGIIQSFNGQCGRRKRRFKMALSILVILFLFLFNLNNCFPYAAVNGSNVVSSQESRYTIIVDAGSSGSRLFVYCIPARKVGDDPLPTITLCLDAEGNPLTKKVKPGLSSFSSDPSSVQSYIHGLLSFAAKNIPKQYHSITPVYILATAGMRFLSQSDQDAIWSYVQSTVKREFHFNFENSWAQTVTGFYEALYGWITVNYLLGNFAEPLKPTVGMLDMGGASMQIAYEVPPELNPPEDLILPFTIGGTRTHNVYVMTFLGYGTQAAKSRYKLALLHNAMEYSQYSGLLKHRFRPSTGYVKIPKLDNHTVELHYTTTGEEKFILSDPCLQPGLEDRLDRNDLTLSRTILATGNSSSPTIAFVGTGNLTLCIEYQKSLLEKQKPCKLHPCSMNGIHQPAVEFEGTSFYAMSEYWYTSSDLGTSGLSNIYAFEKFSSNALHMCRTPWQSSLTEYLKKNVDPSAIANKHFMS
uniref:Ectonucleoside triphosphate diphosphohydrolase 5 n=1 Tax=Rodentolepis nana TaxID=102285 RepID=A0A0R3TXX2_RODNA